MRLVLRHLQDHLDRADDRVRRLLGGEHEPLAACGARGHPLPEGVRLAAGHRRHEADGGAALDAVDQDVTQSLDLAVADGLETPNADRVHRVISWRSARARW